MHLKDIVELLVQYEETHAVEEYMAYDWHAWPALRILAADSMRSRSPLKTETLGGAGKAQGIKRLGVASLHMLGLRRLGASCPGVEESDIVVLTSGNRAIEYGEFFYNSVVDPFVEVVTREGKTCTVWELADEPKLPRRGHPYFIQWPRFHEDRLVEVLPAVFKLLKEPLWFEEYSAWWQSNLGDALSWNSWNRVRRRLMAIEVWSRFYEKRLRRSGCSTLLVDVWYGQDIMGATLAASRLGVRSMDLQHGLQGAAHFAYSSWTKAPEDGYEIMPDGFWVWGNADAEALVKLNNDVISKENVLVGGNLWLNMWRAGDDSDAKGDIEEARALTKGHKKAILITLQKDIPYGNDIFPVIQNCPRDWLWLIRVHRGDFSRIDTIEAEFLSLRHPGINLREATSLPLYALFKACDCHITWYSTCAIEALAFGVPSLILHPDGAHYFKRYIEAGVMSYCNEIDKARECIDLCDAISPEACLRLANSAFASSEVSRFAVKELIADIDAGRE